MFLLFHFYFFGEQVQTLFKYCPQENAAGVFCLDARAQDAVIALGLYFLESGYQYSKEIIPYLLRLAKALPKAVWIDDVKPNKIDKIPTAEKFSFCLNSLLSDIAVGCPEHRDEIIVNQVEVLTVLTNMIKGMPYLDYVSLRQNRLRSIENTASRAPVDPCHGDPKYHHETATFGSILSIDLVGNRLTVVNFSIFTPMHNLNKLFLGHNSLTEMYATEDQLPDGLEYIDLSFNQLSAKADFGALISVKSLDVDSNQDRS